MSRLPQMRETTWGAARRIRARNWCDRRARTRTSDRNPVRQGRPVRRLLRRQPLDFARALFRGEALVAGRGSGHDAAAAGGRSLDQDLDFASRLDLTDELLQLGIA